MNDTVNEHVYTVNKRVSIREETGVNGKELHSEIMNHTPPRYKQYNMVVATQKLRRSKTASEDRGVPRTDTPMRV